ncbi:MAG: cellulase family glycosylhydrolase [Caldilineaceae bacterium]|nr:cellulase family glycosylhydrolase [Caldilineaceae bacterium]
MIKTSQLRLRYLHGLALAVLVALLALPAAATAAPAQSKGFVPFTAKNGCLDQRTPSVFGMQVYSPMNKNSPYFPYFQNSGASWVRVPIYWSTVQPGNANQYNWGPIDALLNVYNTGCANVIATIDMAPAWAQAIDGSPRGPIKQAQMGNFVKFVQTLVERYDGDGNADSPIGIVVNHWEFYNEPDFGANPGEGNGWGNYGSQYAAMLKAVYQPVHTANPNAQVVMGGIAYDGFVGKGGPFVESFLDDVLTAGGGSAFDVMNFHYYPAFRMDWTQTQGTGLPEKIAAIRQKLADHALDKPLVITEAGWHSDEDNQISSSPEEQSRYVVRFFAQSMAYGLRFTVWWMLHDGLIESAYQFANGLVTDTTPPVAKPAYQVYQTAVNRIARAQFVAALSAAETQDPNLEVYQFAEAYTGKRMYVAWINPVESSETRPLSVAGGTAAIYSKENTLQGVVRDGDANDGDGAQDGKITLPVGSSPLYIVMD